MKFTIFMGIDFKRAASQADMPLCPFDRKEIPIHKVNTYFVRRNIFEKNKDMDWKLYDSSGASGRLS